MLRFDVFGILVGLEYVSGSWHAYYLGPEGKRRPADFVIPALIEADELTQFLSDLFHESASPHHPDVRRLGQLPSSSK